VKNLVGFVAYSLPFQNIEQTEFENIDGYRTHLSRELCVGGVVACGKSFTITNGNIV